MTRRKEGLERCEKLSEILLKKNTSVWKGGSWGMASEKTKTVLTV